MSPCAVRVGKSGGRPDTLNVPDDGGDFHVVAEPDEFGHQRDARTRRARHRARAAPTCADGHADRGKLILGLHYGECRFAGLRVDTQSLQVCR